MKKDLVFFLFWKSLSKQFKIVIRKLIFCSMNTCIGSCYKHGFQHKLVLIMVHLGPGDATLEI